MGMDERKIQILASIIKDYIETAEPVGSRTIAKKYDLGISSATIRNEMADLEDMGYLDKTHSSSGRKPSDKGYRLYVDKLMGIPSLSYEEKLYIKNKILDSAIYQVDNMLKQAATLMSELTNLISLARTPSISNSTIKALQLLRVNKSDVLLIIVTNNGIIKDSLIRLVKPLDDDTLIRINNLLNLKLRNLSVEEINLKIINSIKNDLKGYDNLFNTIISALYESLVNEDSSKVIVEGTSNIFNYPEYSSIEKARDFLTMINDEKEMKELLNTAGTLSVTIGSENQLKNAKDCSIITAQYTIGDKPIGSIGIIGPTRMPYSKILSIMNTVVREINDSISRHYYDDR
jgi:heat-inducible transcriptional repressor